MSLEETIQKEFVQHFSILDRLIAEIDTRLLGLDIREMSELPHSAAVLLFMKMIKSAKAVRQLIVSGYGQDALQIAASLFQIMISLEYIEKDPAPRSKAFLDYCDYRGHERVQRLDQYGSKGLLGGDKQSPGNQDWLKDPFEQKCAQVGREKEYDLVYYQLSESAHSGIAGLHYFSQKFTNRHGNVIQMFNAGPRETATSDAIWLNLYFIRSIVDAFRKLNPPHFTDIASGMDPLSNKLLVIEQVAVRLQRIFRMEFPDLPINVEFDTETFKLFVKHANAGDKQKYAMDGDYEGFFLPESLLGYAYQIFTASCKKLNLAVPCKENYNAYIF